MVLSRHRFNRAEKAAQQGVELIEQRVKNPNARIYRVSAEGLEPLAIRPSLPEYLRQLWDRRFFIVADARAKALRSTRDYRLWRTWLVLNPLFDVALYGFLFGFLFKSSRGIDNFIGFLFIGIIFMRMMSGLFTSGSGLMTASRSMIRAFNFPRASIIFSQTLRAMIDNVLPALVCLVSAFLLQWGTPPRWTLIFIVPLFLLLHIFGTGLMFIMARLTAEIPDVKALVPLVTSAWFFLSGVMFSLDRFASFGKIHAIMTANPAHTFLTVIRDSTIYGQVPSLAEWATLLAWTFGTFIVGFVYFWLAEDKYVRIA